MAEECKDAAAARPWVVVHGCTGEGRIIRVGLAEKPTDKKGQEVSALVPCVCNQSPHRVSDVMARKRRRGECGR
jgi:hypothetical protein